MPRRVARLARKRPTTTALILLTIPFSIGVWRVEHLYNCVQSDAEKNAKVLKADNETWDAASSLVAENNPEDVVRLEEAIKHRAALAKDLGTSRESCFEALS